MWVCCGTSICLMFWISLRYGSFMIVCFDFYEFGFKFNEMDNFNLIYVWKLVGNLINLCFWSWMKLMWIISMIFNDLNYEILLNLGLNCKLWSFWAFLKFTSFNVNFGI